jgi:hypothetical protein
MPYDSQMKRDMGTTMTRRRPFEHPFTPAHAMD